jgi:hypothetical protein
MNWYDEERRILGLQQQAHSRSWSPAGLAADESERRRSLRPAQVLTALGIRLVRFGYWLQARASVLPPASAPPTLPARTANNGNAC